jgi:hypothetical protein
MNVVHSDLPAVQRMRQLCWRFAAPEDRRPHQSAREMERQVRQRDGRRA